VATFLHRLGRWCARHPWRVVTAWAALLALTVTGMLTLAKPLSNEFSIPGSRFEAVLQTLQDEIPEAAGTTGTIVFRADQPFTAAQEDAVAGAVERWNDLPDVTATDPFEAQAAIDSTDKDLADGRDQLEQGRTELEQGEADLEAARQKVTDGRAQLKDGEQRLAESRAQLEAAQAQLEAGQTEIDAQLAELEAGVAAGLVPPAQAERARAQITAGQAQLDASRTELEAGQAELETGEAQLKENRARLDDAEEQVAQGEQELADGRAELEQGETDLAVGRRMADLTDGFRVVTEDRTVAMTQLSVQDAGGLIPPETTTAIQTIGNELDGAGITVSFSKEITDDLSSLLGPGEVIGLLIAGVVLLVMLGSLVAAGLPLLMALVGVGVGLTGALALSRWVDMMSITPVLALMLGLAVGIDYSLFLINRHRQQLRRGMPLRQSIALAVGTSGNAVTFAGLTVIIALAALTLTGIPFLGVMGLVAAGTVAIAVLVAITLTPAMLALLGDRVLPKKARFALAGSDRSVAAGPLAQAGRTRREHAETQRGWAARVQRHPWLAIVAVLVIVAGLGYPTGQLRLGLPDGGSEPAGSSAYQTYDTVREEFGAGANGPIIAVAELDTPVAAGQTALMTAQADIAEDLAAVDGVVRVLPAGVNDERDVLAFQLQPEGGPAEASTEDLVHRLSGAVEQVGADNAATIGITGQTVANIDISGQLADALPIYLLVVVGLSLLLLLLVFRSVVIPLLATGGFLLSIVAAFGAVVAVYQLGHLSPVFDVHEPGPILSFLPILLIGILFGLAMDYQVFLVSAMREEHVHGKDARTAVVTGFNHSARVVTAAAIIMISVFAGFVWAHLAMVRPIGLGLAVGVLVDAFLVRMTLTPAVMSLLGEKAWWLPRWLDRILPDVDVEGAKLERTVGAPSVDAPVDDGRGPEARGGADGAQGEDEPELSPSR
jgi:putative drug exporter of the RND superfamily